VGIDFLGGLIVRVKIFPPLNPTKPQFFAPFSDDEKRFTIGTGDATE